MDVCTLVLITTINAIGCAKAEECYTKNDKKICIPFHSIACPIYEPTYDCKKQDGTRYTLKQSELN